MIVYNISTDAFEIYEFIAGIRIYTIAFVANIERIFLSGDIASTSQNLFYTLNSTKLITHPDTSISSSSMQAVSASGTYANSIVNITTFYSENWNSSGSISQGELTVNMSSSQTTIGNIAYDLEDLTIDNLLK